MYETIKKTIEVLAERAIQDPDPRVLGADDSARALKYTQAAANIANAGLTLLAIQKEESP